MVDELIVLGLIPGTQLQITFELWLTLLATIAAAISLWRTYRAQIVQRWVIITTIVVMTHRRLKQVQLYR
jgi:hypothetical protein